jgi:hypothetical protein
MKHGIPADVDSTYCFFPHFHKTPGVMRGIEYLRSADCNQQMIKSVERTTAMVLIMHS